MGETRVQDVQPEQRAQDVKDIMCELLDVFEGYDLDVAAEAWSEFINHEQNAPLREALYRHAFGDLMRWGN